MNSNLNLNENEILYNGFLFNVEKQPMPELKADLHFDVVTKKPVVALVVLDEAGNTYMVKQSRAGLKSWPRLFQGLGQEGSLAVETIAGHIESGSATDTVIIEAKQEMGLRLVPDDLITFRPMFISPGWCNEICFPFVVNLSKESAINLNSRIDELYGSEEENEKINLVKVEFKDWHKIQDVKFLSTMYYFHMKQIQEKGLINSLFQAKDFKKPLDETIEDAKFTEKSRQELQDMSAQTSSG